MKPADFAARLTEIVSGVMNAGALWPERDLTDRDLQGMCLGVMILVRAACPHRDLVRDNYIGHFFCRTCQQKLNDHDLLTAFAAQPGSGQPACAAPAPVGPTDEEVGFAEETRDADFHARYGHYRN